jgi:hypothetical protein
LKRATGFRYNTNMPVLKGLEITNAPGAESPKGERFPIRSGMRVCCLGSDPAAEAQGLKSFAHGRAFVISEELPYSALIQVALPKSGLSAVARVHNCEPQDGGWRVGVELLGSLV